MQNINLHHFSGNLEAKNLSAEIFIKQLSEFRELPANEDILEVTYKYTTIKDENNNFKRSDDGDILAWNHILSALSGVSYDDAISAKFSPEEIIKNSENKIINRQQKLDEMAKNWKIQISVIVKNDCLILLLKVTKIALKSQKTDWFLSSKNLV